MIHEDDSMMKVFAALKPRHSLSTGFRPDFFNTVDYTTLRHKELISTIEDKVR